MSNPLIAAYRKPKVYVTLPSNGRFYTEKPTLSVDGELAIYPMTARDELITKNPDALFNGEATMALLKSCCPDIPDPHQVPMCDLPVIMIAIRQASYGDYLELDLTCPECDAINQVKLQTSAIIGSVKQVTDKDVAEIAEGFKVKLKPYNIDDRTILQIQQIKQQKLIESLLQTDMDEEERNKRFGSLFVELAELTVSLIRNCIIYVETPDGERVTDNDNVLEWLQNISKKDYDSIKDVVEQLSESGLSESFSATCQSCDHTWKTPVELDAANFFVG